MNFARMNPADCLVATDESQALPIRRGRVQLLIGTAALSMASAMLNPTPAAAQTGVNACGAAVNAAVTCTAAGNPYPNGITYSVTNPDPNAVPDLTVTLQDGVAVKLAENAGPNNAIQATGTGRANVSLTGAANTSITSSTAPAAAYGQFGVLVTSQRGNAVGSVGTVNTTGNYGYGVFVTATQGGNVTVNATTVNTTGRSSTGLVGISNNVAGSAGGSVTITGGRITTAGAYSNGVTGRATRGGNVTITTGDISTVGAQAAGIYGVPAPRPAPRRAIFRSPIPVPLPPPVPARAAWRRWPGTGRTRLPSTTSARPAQTRTRSMQPAPGPARARAP